MKKRDDLLPPIRVKVIDTPDHYYESTGTAQKWREEAMNKIIVVQEYTHASLDHAYHITNCPENDAIPFFHTRNAYKRGSMTLHKRFFIPLYDNVSVKNALTTLQGE